jgi:hypothetical protein
MLGVGGLRILSVALTWAFVASASSEVAYLAGVFGLGMAHYVASFIYSKRQLSEFVSGRRSRLAFAVLFGMGVALAWAPHAHAAKLVYYFALHHIFNEVYLVGRITSSTRAFRAIAIVYHTVVYFAVLLNEEFLAWSVPFLTPQVVAPVLAVAAAAYAAAWVPLLRSRRGRGLLSVGLMDLGLLALAGASIAGMIHVQYLDVVMYHFVLWALYPVNAFVRRPETAVPAMLKYLAITAGLLVLFIWTATPHIRPGSPVWTLFFVFSYLHITTAFALSDAFPSWITIWFQPSREAAAVGSHAPAHSASHPVP